MNGNRVAIISGARTPFVKAGKEFSDLGTLALGAGAVSGLVGHLDLDPGLIEALVFGAVVTEPGKPNLARELVFETGLPTSIEGQTISSYCISGLRAVTAVAEGIGSGRIGAGIAGGADSFSHATKQIFREPSTGLSMGQHMEITSKEWKVRREPQDELALASHHNAVAAREKLSSEIVPLLGVDRDTGPRESSNLESLASLRPVFDDEGTLSAGNSSPVTDGASALLLMSEELARAEGLEPLAYIRAMAYGAIPVEEGLLMAPAEVVPRLLTKEGIHLGEIDLVEIHEAFAAQVLANGMAWEQGWKGDPLGPLDWSRVNVNGSSLALGHPWSATGGRILTTLANEMARRDSRYGLVSICAAGAMAGAFLLERD